MRTSIINRCTRLTNLFPMVSTGYKIYTRYLLNSFRQAHRSNSVTNSWSRWKFGKFSRWNDHTQITREISIIMGIVYNRNIKIIKLIKFVFILACHKVDFIAPCGENKSIFWPSKKKNRVRHGKSINFTRVVVVTLALLGHQTTIKIYLMPHLASTIVTKFKWQKFNQLAILEIYTF